MTVRSALPTTLAALALIGCAKTLDISDYDASCEPSTNTCLAIEMRTCTCDCEAGAVVDSERDQVAADRKENGDWCQDQLWRLCRCVTTAAEATCVEGACTLLDEDGNDLGRTTSTRSKSNG